MPVLRPSAFACSAVLAVVGTAAPAHAAGTSWHTMQDLIGAKHQACRVATASGDGWRIKNRVDARHATGRVNARAIVQKNGHDTTRVWKSGWVAKGTVLGVGSVVLPKGSQYTVVLAMGADGFGGGGEFHAGDIGRC